MDVTVDDPSPPFIPARWFRPTTSTPHLQLPTAPVTVANVDSWIALSVHESNQCEELWNKLSDEQRRLAEASCQDDDEPQTPRPVEECDEDEEVTGVAIFEERLFEVDVKSMELRPIYWKANTPPVRVQRVTWMYDESHPVPKHLSNQLDVAYRAIQPWQPSYKYELETASRQGPEAYEKLKHPLIPASQSRVNPTQEGSQSFVMFEDAFTAKISSRTTKQFFSNSLFGSRTRPAKNHILTFSGTTVYHGYDAALAASNFSKYTTQDSDASSGTESQAAVTIRNPSGIDVGRLKPSDMKTQRAEYSNNHTGERIRQPSHPVDNGFKKVTDLILVVHGIGQGLASQYESWSFLYAVNYFRQLAKKQATLPALASILRDKQVQFLPIQWRTSLYIGEEEQKEREREGLDNTFSISDITPRKSIPTIRELTNNVLIEIPYFMSHHQHAMIESVCMQANRTYRRWCARNPGFDQYGRVHIIGHSLGSLLSACILSTQPTIQPPLSYMSPESIRQCKKQFLFNTSSFFIVGSPLPVFVHLNHTQVIARKGRERTKDSPDDEALDREGLFGCFAIDSLYNIFHPSDPIAYLLNPCVDAKFAKNMPPSTVPVFNAGVMSTISTRFAKLFVDVMPRSFGSSSPISRTHSPDGHPVMERVQSTFELSGHNQVLQGSRAERRFAALNPHGTLDFQLASEGSISEYVDMITAHSSYWQDPNLAAFILVELFANPEDLARTGLVPATNQITRT